MAVSNHSGCTCESMSKESAGRTSHAAIVCSMDFLSPNSSCAGGPTGAAVDPIRRKQFVGPD